jgi:hypothetical protein
MGASIDKSGIWGKDQVYKRIGGEVTMRKSVVMCGLAPLFVLGALSGAYGL